jgi:hypothetical protein
MPVSLEACFCPCYISQFHHFPTHRCLQASSSLEDHIKGFLLLEGNDPFFTCTWGQSLIRLSDWAPEDPGNGTVNALPGIPEEITCKCHSPAE